MTTLLPPDFTALSDALHILAIFGWLSLFALGGIIGLGLLGMMLDGDSR